MIRFDYPGSGVSVYLMRDTRRKNVADACPLKWGVRYENERIYLPAEASLCGDDWADFIRQRKQVFKDLRITLENQYKREIDPHIKDLTDAGCFSFDTLRERLDAGDRHSLNDAFTYKINQLISSGNIGNATVYKTTYNNILKFGHFLKSKHKKEFIQQCKNDNFVTKGKNKISITAKIPFSDISPRWLDDCEKFWREIGMGNSSIGMYMRTLRALINNKGGEPYLTGVRYPFKRYSIPQGGRKETALPIEDIRKIENYEPVNYSQEIAKDVFLFLFYANGMNYGDMCRLQYDNINNDEIVFQRKKTLRKWEAPTYVYVPLIEPLIMIMNKWGNKDGYIFPFLNGIDPEDEESIKKQINLSLQPINTSLKVIASELEIDPSLSTGHARNSYISYLTSELLISPIVVRKMVGHSTKQDVTAGYVNLTAKKRRQINTQLFEPSGKTLVIRSM